jgi:hypothetical protein
MTEAKADSTPFQKLLFLIRDWNLDDSEGYVGGQVLLNKRLVITPKMNEEKRDLRKHIMSCFKVNFQLLTLKMLHYLPPQHCFETQFAK